MSVLLNTNTLRINKLYEFSKAIVYGIDPSRRIKENKNLIESIKPSEVIIIVDKLVSDNIPGEKLKTGVNKLINLFYKTLNGFDYPPHVKNSFLDYLQQDNKQLDIRLKKLKEQIKYINKNPDDRGTLDKLKKMFIDIELFNKHYQIKENILFPKLEEKWTDYRCLQLMWSFHDDIRQNIKTIINLLRGKSFNLKIFNKLTGSIFFNMYAIIFREEKIMFPIIIETISIDEMQIMVSESFKIGYPYIKPKKFKQKKSNIEYSIKNEIDLKSGYITPEQIGLIFNHLPVDITFVDENNKVRYFSTPKKIMFYRTNSIIGRDVKNCHPPDSFHIVNKIIEAFKKGEKDLAKFWLKIKGELVLIQYFAVRNESGEYKGVLEVSQEINDIKEIEGEKKLLDWE